MTNQKHLTLENRITIEKSLTEGKSRAEIAREVGKDKSTICKEVKLHSFLSPFKRQGHRSSYTYDCSKISECGYNGLCREICENRSPIYCKRRDRTVGVCNGCPDLKSCKLDRRFYSASESQSSYEYTLHDSREGVDLTTSQAQEIGNILKPLLQQGQSIHVINYNHPEIGKCDKTLYTYINDGVFSINGIVNLDLRMKTKRKMPSKKTKSKPRENRAYLKGRLYSDFEKFIGDHPSDQFCVVEMDTVYNDVSNGPFVQTFQFVKINLMIGIYHEEKTAQAMLEGVKLLKDLLGEELFKKLVKVILTDRGTEFTAAEETEKLGCKIFFCDPMCSWQKPHVENNHKLFRYICPKKTNLYESGLRSQEDLDLIFSHINSYRREEKANKSPIEELNFYYPDMGILEKLNLKEIEPDNVVLTPALIKK